MRGKATSDYSQPNLLYSVQPNFQNIDVAQLLRAFPSASGKMTGTIKGNLNLSGEAVHSSNPLSGLRGTGRASVRNGRLPTLQLTWNLMFLVRMAGIGPPSGDPASFSSASTDLNLANQQLVSRNVRVVSNDFFDLRGTLENPKFAITSAKGTLGSLVGGATSGGNKAPSPLTPSRI